MQYKIGLLNLFIKIQRLIIFSPLAAKNSSFVSFQSVIAISLFYIGVLAAIPAHAFNRLDTTDFKYQGQPQGIAPTNPGLA